MGSYLDKPLTEKEQVDVSVSDHRFVLSSMQGWPTTMEDAHCATAKLPSPFEDWSFYAVFDGHAGGTVSEFASKNLVKRIAEAMKHTFRPSSPNKGNQSSQQINSSTLVELIKNCFFQIDDEMRESIESLKGEDKSGSTAVAVLISPTHLYMINCGDSRAVFVKDGKVEFATADHKPTNELERKRIEAAGGGVLKKRVNGLLAVSRALGDFDYKGDTERDQKKQLLSADPDIEVIPRNSLKDHFVILACDGVWDVMSNEEAMNFVRSRLILHKNYRKVCDEVADTCLHKGSRDNISIGLVLFHEGISFSEKVVREAKEREATLKDELRKKVFKIFKDHPNPDDMDMPLLIQALSGDATDDLKDYLPPGGGLAAMRSFLQELYYEKYPERKLQDTSKKSEQSEFGTDSIQSEKDSAHHGNGSSGTRDTHRNQPSSPQGTDVFDIAHPKNPSEHQSNPNHPKAHETSIRSQTHSARLSKDSQSDISAGVPVQNTAATHNVRTPTKQMNAASWNDGKSDASGLVRNKEEKDKDKRKGSGSNRKHDGADK